MTDEGAVRTERGKRDVRTVTITYKGESVAFDLPGWYHDGSGEGVHSSEDMKVADLHLAELKARMDNLLGPGEGRLTQTLPQPSRTNR